MRFFILNNDIGDEATSVQEIESYLRGQEEQQSHKYTSETSAVLGYLIVKFVKELAPIKQAKNWNVLQLVLTDVKVKQGPLSCFTTRFYNDMALVMDNAIKNQKINASDLIVLKRPIVHYNTTKSNEARKKGLDQIKAVELGLADDPSIDVWQSKSAAMNTKLPLNSILECVYKLGTTSLQSLVESIAGDSCTTGKVLCYFIKPVQFWETDDQACIAMYLFREIQPSGDGGVFFKISFYGALAAKFHQAVSNKSVVQGDIIALVNPIIFENQTYDSGHFSSGEPYYVEMFYLRRKVSVILCKNLFPESQSDFPVLICSAGPQENNSLMPTVSTEGTRKPKDDDTALALISLVKPSLEILDMQNLNLVSGYCNEYCGKMFMYCEIVWNAKKEPLCPKCYVILQLRLCMEFQALFMSSGKFAVALLEGSQAETFLQVSCKDFLENNEARKLALKVLQSKYVKGSEYTCHLLKLSDVSFFSMLNTD